MNDPDIWCNVISTTPPASVLRYPLAPELLPSITAGVLTVTA